MEFIKEFCLEAWQNNRKLTIGVCLAVAIIIIAIIA